MTFQWITPKREIACPKLWKDFPARGAVSARLEITGLGVYRAYLNGQRVGEDYLTPGFNDYDAYVRYQTYEVGALLAEENRLEVYLGNGWYKGRFGWGEHEFNRWGDQYLLAVRLILQDSDGKETVICTDESWRACQSPILDGGIYEGEIRDDTRPAGEDTPCAVVEKPYRLEPQFSPPIRVRARLKPALIITPKGEQVLDFGQNMAGVIRFVNRLQKGQTLRIQTGEVLQEGCFYRDNLRTAKSEYIYTSDGTEKEIEPLFTFYGFRYAKVEGLERVNPEDFTALALCSDLKETLQCETGHPLLNQLMQNTLWGQRSNFLDVPTDCPQRDERQGWTGDTQVFCTTACYQMDCKDFYRKFMRDMRADQTLYYAGDLPKYSPALRGDDLQPGGAVWADAGTIVPWNVYMQYGDEGLLRENYPMMRDYAECLIAADEKAGGTHLIFHSHTFGDWLAQDGLTPQSVYGGTANAYIQGVYYYNSICLTAQAAKVLGAPEAKKYADLAEEIKASLLAEYVSPNGNLTEDTQTGYVLALRYGIYRDRDKLIAGFRRRLRRDFFRITCGFTGAPLILPVLLDCGMEEEAYRMLLREEFPGWLYSVKLGATTIWERWNSLNPDGSISGTGMNSLNHYAYGSVCEAIYSRIMGLSCAAPGWKKALIAPRPDGRLGHANIRFDSPAGVWAVSWRILEDGQITLEAQVPEGTEATLRLPDYPENLTLTLGPGSYAYTWRPTRDYRHPFSINSLIMDLMGQAETARILSEMHPELYRKASVPGAEVLVKPLKRETWHRTEAQIQALDQALRQVRI